MATTASNSSGATTVQVSSERAPNRVQLRLEGANAATPESPEPSSSARQRGVTFDDSTMVDNENMGKKSSKCCCVYEKPREFGESSSESSGDEGNEDDGHNCHGGCRGHKKSKQSKKMNKNYFKETKDPPGNNHDDNAN